jgi:hypothetical protein
MTYLRAFATVIGSTLLFAVIGGGLGYGLGRFMPGYYRGVFHGGDDPAFDPVSVGLGQGLTQGTVGGVAAGLVLVAILSWRETRLLRGAGPSADDPGGGGASVHQARRILRSVTAVLSFAFCAALFLAIGAFATHQSCKHERYELERSLLQPILSRDPAFSGFELDESSRGGAELSVQVPTQADADRLRDAIVRAVGELRARELMRGVTVRQ